MIDVNGNKHEISSINLPPGHKEMFYHFSTTLEKKPAHIIHGNRIFAAGLPDHISFHEDGTVHVTHKKPKYRKVIDKLNKNIFDLYLKNQVVPLLMDSVFPSPSGLLLPTLKDKDAGDALVWPMKKSGAFSIILFLISATVNPKGFLEKHDINNKCRLHKQKYLIEAFEGWFVMATLSGMILVDNTARDTDMLPNGVYPSRAFVLGPKIT